MSLSPRSTGSMPLNDAGPGRGVWGVADRLHAGSRRFNAGGAGPVAVVLQIGRIGRKGEYCESSVRVVLRKLFRSKSRIGELASI
jgi:hypothetical protein